MTAERPDSSYKHSPQKTTKSFAKILDTHKISGTTLTQQLRRKGGLCPDKQAFFTQPSRITQALHFTS